jgi:hypothetical protein
MITTIEAIMATVVGFAPHPVYYIKRTFHDYRSTPPRIRVVDLP